MSRRETHLTLSQMLAYASEARELAQGRTRADLDHERMLELAVLRVLEVIGESATRLPDEIRARHPEVPWGSIIGLRNRLIHAYDEVDLDIVWDVLAFDVPDLVEKLERMLNAEGSA
jgi:uncharacterized protein with HEPN domain